MAPFVVEAPNEELAMRVYMAYFATLGMPMDILQAVVHGIVHLHTEPGDGQDCDEG
jgi:hypothetical protein